MVLHLTRTRTGTFTAVVVCTSAGLTIAHPGGALASTCPQSSNPQIFMRNTNTDLGYTGEFGNIQRLSRAGSYSTPGCDYDSILFPASVQTMHFALNGKLGFQVELGPTWHKTSGGVEYLGMFFEYQNVSSAVVAYYADPNHTVPGFPTAPCAQSADNGYTTYKTIWSGAGNQTSGFTWNFYADCGGGLQAIGSMGGVKSYKGLATSEYEELETGLSPQTLNHKDLKARRADNGWDNWTGVSCIGTPNNMTNWPTVDSATQWHLSAAGICH